MEVKLRARVSFDLPSSPSPVDPTSEEGEEENGDSVVSTPLVADWTLISIVTFFFASNPILVIFFLCLSLRTAGLKLSIQCLFLERRLVSVSVSLPRLLRLKVLVI